MLGGLAMAGLAAYLNFRPEQHWILALTALIAAAGVESAVRSHPDWRGSPFGSLSYALLPLLGVLGAGLFIDEAVSGYARLAAGLAAGAATGLMLYAEYHAVSPSRPLFGPMRLVLAVVTYLVALALFTVFFTHDLNLPASAAAVGALSFALALDLLRESRGRGASSLLAALAIGISLAELRIALYYFPLDDLLTGALMIIGFYVATGLVHHLLDDDLKPSTIAEYLVVAGVSTAVVVIARQYL
ncbi:MAG: hypothetical protein OXH12_01310 [Chloroflexi bacterium]|nr:hypothetical protein [Chloroflexota bacterium]